MDVRFAIYLLAALLIAGPSSAQDGTKVFKTNKVTHYYVPLLGSSPPNKRNCHTIEGVCKYLIDGKAYIYNYTGESAPGGAAFAAYAKDHDALVSEALCKHGKGYGINSNCTHPCRSLAASTTHHTRGELLFFPKLVGVACGSGNSTITHDGYMLVNDTGAKRHFNRTGRFDFFWGDCNSFNQNAVCLDGNALAIDRDLDNAEYRLIWTPEAPDTNRDVARSFSATVRAEALKRGDGPEAIKFDIEEFLPGGRHHRR